MGSRGEKSKVSKLYAQQTVKVRGVGLDLDIIEKFENRVDMKAPYSPDITQEQADYYDYNIRPNIQGFIETYSNKPIEHGFAIRSDGRITDVIKGKANKVPTPLDDGYKPEGLASMFNEDKNAGYHQMKDATFIHNHPVGTSFSYTDINNAIKLDTYSIVATGINPGDGCRYTYTMIRPKNGYRRDMTAWDTPEDWDHKTPYSDTINAVIYRYDKAIEELQQKGGSKDVIDRLIANREVHCQDKVMEIMLSNAGMTYIVEKHDPKTGRTVVRDSRVEEDLVSPNFKGSRKEGLSLSGLPARKPDKNNIPKFAPKIARPARIVDISNMGYKEIQMLKDMQSSNNWYIIGHENPRTGTTKFSVSDKDAEYEYVNAGRVLVNSGILVKTGKSTPTGKPIYTVVEQYKKFNYSDPDVTSSTPPSITLPKPEVKTVVRPAKVGKLSIDDLPSESANPTTVVSVPVGKTKKEIAPARPAPPKVEPIPAPKPTVVEPTPKPVAPKPAPVVVPKPVVVVPKVEPKVEPKPAVKPAKVVEPKPKAIAAKKEAPKSNVEQFKEAKTLLASNQITKAEYNKRLKALGLI